MEKYTTVRESSRDVPVGILADIYKEVSFRRQMLSNRVDAVKANNSKSDELPAWRGDHTFSSDAAKYSFLNFIEPEVAQKHPDWSKQKIRKEAITKFQQRLEQDLLYEQKESSHEETAVQWKVIEVSHGVKELATDYGGEVITLKQLWDHTREYARFVGIPAAYNKEEEKAQLAMEQSFVRGDISAYVSVISHPDAVRYVQVWERGAEGTIASKQIDLYKTTGRDFSHTEGSALVSHLAEFTKKEKGSSVIVSEAEYAHFMIGQGGVSEADIRIIASMQTRVSEAQVLFPTMPIHAVESSQNVPNPVFGEAKDIFADLRAYVSEAINQKITHMKKKSPETTKSSTSKELHKKSSDVAVERVLIESASTHPIVKQVTQNEKQALFETPSTMKEVLSDWVISQTAINYISMYPESAGGALFWVLHLGESSKDRSSEKFVTALHHDIADTLQKMMHSVGKLFEKNNDMPLAKNIIAEIHPERSEKTPNTDVSEKEKVVIERIKNLFVLLIADKEVSILESAKAIFEDITVLLWPKSSKQEAHTKSMSKDNAQHSQESIQIKKPERSTVLFIHSLLYWIILSYSFDNVRHETSKTKQTNDGLVLKKIDGKTREDSKEVQSPPWILLSIIWHLSMIREAAMVSVQATPVQQKKSTPSPVSSNASIVSILPLTGVIFPRAFVLE